MCCGLCYACLCVGIKEADADVTTNIWEEMGRNYPSLFVLPCELTGT